MQQGQTNDGAVDEEQVPEEECYEVNFLGEWDEEVEPCGALEGGPCKVCEGALQSHIVYMPAGGGVLEVEDLVLEVSGGLRWCWA
eukprot:4689001-Ditylum_brightwellii.AAC.1